MTDSRPLLSIVIPAYNSEKSIITTLQSIVNQRITPPRTSDFVSYTNTSDTSSVLNSIIEIVVVNDGSTDDTKTIVERLQISYPFIRLYNKENRGVSSARNDGIKLSKGQYVAFLDADDSYLEGAINCIISTINEYNPDVIQYSVFTPRKSTDSLTINAPEIIYNGSVEEYFKEKTCSSSVFSKIIRRELIHDCGLTFSNELSIGEDVMWSLNLFNEYPQARIIVDTFCLVRYNYNSQSVLNTTNRARLCKNIEAYIAFYRRLNDYSSISHPYLKQSIDRVSRICQRGIITRHLSVLLSLRMNKRYIERLNTLNVFPLQGSNAFTTVINHCYKHIWSVQLLQFCYSTIVRFNLRKYLVRT